MLKMDQLIKHSGVEGRGAALKYLKMGENFRSIETCFRHFPIPLGPLLTLTRYYWPSLFAKTNCLSLSHLVPEIIWSKVGLFFLTKICHLTLLMQFVPIFSLIFNLVDHLIHCLILDLFYPSFYKTMDHIGYIFSSGTSHKINRSVH